MSGSQRKSSETENFTDHPLVTYSNRIQNLMNIVSNTLSHAGSSSSDCANAVRTLIMNFPPNGKTALAPVIAKLGAFHSNYDSLSRKDFEDMYGIASDWFYVNILQDAFRAIPLNRRAGRLAEKPEGE